MKKYITRAVALSAFIASSSFAADLPSRKEPIAAPPPPPMWSGFYAGLNVGYGVGTSNSVTTSGLPFDPWAENQRIHSAQWNERSLAFSAANSSNFAMSQAGILGGGQVGYNYMVMDRYLIGFETDFQGSAISGANSQYSMVTDELYFGTTAELSRRDTLGGGSVSAGINWFGTARGRVGYLITPNLLAFGTGGLTYGDVYANVSPVAYSAFSIKNNGLRPYGVSPAFSFPGSQNSLLVGWNAGGGFEWMFMSNWSVKAEAIYYNLGSQNVSNQLATQTVNYQRLIAGNESGWALFSNTKVNYAGIIARMGVNYHFNFASAPIIPKF